MSVEAKCYLELEPRRNYGGDVIGARVVRMTKGFPAMEAGNAAVRVALLIPAEMFDAPEVTVEIEPEMAPVAIEQLTA